MRLFLRAWLKVGILERVFSLFLTVSANRDNHPLPQSIELPLLALQVRLPQGCIHRRWRDQRQEHHRWMVSDQYLRPSFGLQID
jgi:hypothetical protein